MSNHITPTIGRIVWYRGADGEIRAAIVTCVNGDFNVNLRVFGHSASDTECGVVDSVTHADPEVEPNCFPSWHWMPYQIGQAKKSADEPKTAAMAQSAGQISGAGTRDDSYVRFQALDMALRTPGLCSHQDVLRAATAYQEHVAGEKTRPAQLERVAPGAAHPGYSTMQPHQQRVVDEKAELDAKIERLIAFFDTPVFCGLPKDEQVRLDAQGRAMTAYSILLGERIAAFAPAAHTPSNSAWAPNLKPGDGTPV